MKRRSNENGATLIIALIFISLIGLVATALLSYNQTVFRQISVVRRVSARETGTNAGIDWAVQAIQSHAAVCFEGGLAFQMLTINGRAVKVYCKVTNGTASGPGGWALYVTPGGRVETDAAAAAPTTKTIVGPVYNAGTWLLKADLSVDGEVVVPNGKITCTNDLLPVPDSVSPGTRNLLPSFLNVRECEVPLSQVFWPFIPPVPPKPLPPTPPAAPSVTCSDSGTGKIKQTGCTPVAAGPVPSMTADGFECLTFSPGTYTDPPRLAPINYFKPGIYRFDWPSAKTWIVNSSLRGGDPIPLVEKVESTIQRCNTADPVPALVPAGYPYGVSFVFANGANMEIRNSGRVELFSYKNDDNVVPGVIAVSSGASESTSSPLVGIGQGTKPELVIHGGVYAPNSRVELRATNSGIAKIMATTVVKELKLDASASISNANFGVIVPSGNGFKKFKLIAVSTIVGSEPPLCTVANVTVFNDAVGTLGVNSWRVDRDPRTSDPATCSP